MAMAAFASRTSLWRIVIVLGVVDDDGRRTLATCRVGSMRGSTCDTSRRDQVTICILHINLLVTLTLACMPGPIPARALIEYNWSSIHIDARIFHGSKYKY